MAKINNKQGRRSNHSSGHGGNNQIHQNDGGALVAFTDASVSEQGEATAAVILMGVKHNFIHSAHIINLGFGLSSNKAEMSGIIYALNLAPPKSLSRVVCDNIGVIDSLNKYSHRGTAKQVRAMDEPERNMLDHGLIRQPRVRFDRVPRSDLNIRLADKFSRLARGMTLDVKSSQPIAGLTLFEQKQSLLHDLS